MAVVCVSQFDYGCGLSLVLPSVRPEPADGRTGDAWSEVGSVLRYYLI